MFFGAVCRECTATTGTVRAARARLRSPGSTGAAVIAVRRFSTAFEPGGLEQHGHSDAHLDQAQSLACRAPPRRRSANRRQDATGATLHQHFTNAGSVWTLSDGITVNSDVAKIVTGNLNVVGVGDCLFPRVTTVSQSFRWSD
jgi:hypothetical protein